MTVLIYCSPICEKALLSGRFPSFASWVVSGTSDCVYEDEYGDWWNDVDGENRNRPTRRKTCFSATLSMNLRHAYLTSPCLPHSKHSPPWLKYQ